MTQDRNDRDRDALEDGFAGLRADAPGPRPPFMERLMADALAEMPAAAPARPAPRRWRWRDALGGWPGMATLAGSALVGAMVGYMDPAALDGLYDAASGSAAGAAGAGFEEPLLAELTETQP